MNEKIKVFDPYDLSKVIYEIQIEEPKIYDPYDLSKVIKPEEPKEIKPQS